MAYSNRLIILIIACTIFLNSYALYENQGFLTRLNSYEEYIKAVINSDHVSSIIFYRDDCANCRNIEPVYYKLGESMYGLMKTYAIDCEVISSSGNADKFPICDPKYESALPILVFLEPPAQRINPYTRQPMMPIEHIYEGPVSPRTLMDYAKKWMPAYRKKITTQDELNDFLEDSVIPNKVILFTNKEETSPLYKGIASSFKDRLEHNHNAANAIQFAEVHEKQQEICKAYDIKKYPTLVVLEKNDKGYNMNVFTGELTYKHISDYLNGYALETKVIRDEHQGQETKTEEIRKQILNNVNANDYDAKILEIEKLVMVSVYKNEKPEILDESMKKFQNLFDYYALDCTKEENEKYAFRKLGIRTFPSIIIYPIGKGQRKAIKFTYPGSVDINELVQDISDLIEDVTISLAEDNVQIFINNAWSSKKPSFILFYEGRDFSMSYRALTQLSKYTERFNFGAFRNPSIETKQKFNLNKIPTLLVISMKDPNNDEIDPKDNLQVAHYTGRFQYHEVLEFIEMFLPDEEKTVIKNTNKVIEIQTQSDFESGCTKQDRICIIALINGDQSDANVVQKIKEQQEILDNVQKKIGSKSVSLMYLDAICHSEILLQLDFPEEYVPTIIAYFPQKKQFSQIIGIFDYDSIITWIDRVIKGKISTYNLSKALSLESKECESVHFNIKQRELEAANRASEDDDILREILEEERKRREANEDELADGKRKRRKKKKSSDELQSQLII